MEEAICCEFCDHTAVSIRLNGTFTCEYCGADRLLQDWEDYATDHTIRTSDLREVPETTQVQVRGATSTPGQVEGNEAGDSRPLGD